MQRKCIRRECDASAKIGYITLISRRMVLDFKEKTNTFTISFNQQRQKKMQTILCDTSVDEKAKKWPGFQTYNTLEICIIHSKSPLLMVAKYHCI